MRSVLCATFVAPAAAEGLPVAEFWESGTLGVEIVPHGQDEVLARAYFAREVDGPGGVPHAGGLCWGDLEARLVSAVPVPALDWLAVYRRETRPFRLGSRLMVDPGEPDLANETTDGGDLYLRIPAREAFGTGSHASTRLVVEWLERLPLAGLQVLDLGSGTGILSFAALLFGAASVVALDRDPVAVFLASENQRLNRLRFPLVGGTIAALRGRALFDLALVNVLPEAIACDLSDLVAALRPGGGAIFSGFLSAQEKKVRFMLERHGLRIRDCRSCGEWVSLLTEAQSQ